MYKVLCDDYTLHDERTEQIFLSDARLTQELNSIDSFEFTILPNHPYYDKIVLMKSVISVYRDDALLFKGRATSESSNFYNEKTIICESELGFFCDTIQRPYVFPVDPSKTTPRDLLRMFISNHNSQVSEDKQFYIGNVTVTDPNDYIYRADSTYMNTWESIAEKLVNSLGGYIVMRYISNGHRYIDYLAELSGEVGQKIKITSNLLDYNRSIDTEDIFSVIVPLGASDEDQNKLTISSVNSGNDYLESPTLISKYGRIERVVEWDDVTLASNLKTKATNYLKSLENAELIELSALDLSPVEQVQPFEIGKFVYSDKDDTSYLINKLNIDLLNPQNNILTISSNDVPKASSVSTTIVKNSKKPYEKPIKERFNILNCKRVLIGIVDTEHPSKLMTVTPRTRGIVFAMGTSEKRCAMFYLYCGESTLYLTEMPGTNTQISGSVSGLSVTWSSITNGDSWLYAILFNGDAEVTEV